MNNNELYVVTGVSGRTGSAVALTLLKADKRVRVVVRDAVKGNVWAKQGAEVAIADFTDIPALTNALSGAEGAYIVSPQQYALSDLFSQAEIIADAITEAVTKARLPKVVALSSIGAEQSKSTGWISMNRVLEQSLRKAGVPLTLLRAAYFMENWTSMVKVAAASNELPSFLAPLDQKLPMVATNDIGRIAAEALCENWSGTRIINLEGPAKYSPNDVATSLSQVLDKTVRSVAIPESDWTEALTDSGLSAEAIIGFIEMTQGLNSGHIAFADKTVCDHRKGNIPLDAIVKAMSTPQ